MKKVCSWFGIVFFVTMLIAGVSIAGTAATFEGTINDDYQLVTDDGKVYEIYSDEENTEIAEKLAEETNKRVIVKGNVETDDDGTKAINVLSYKIVDTKPSEK